MPYTEEDYLELMAKVQAAEAEGRTLSDYLQDLQMELKVDGVKYVSDNEKKQLGIGTGDLLFSDPIAWPRKMRK